MTTQTPRDSFEEQLLAELRAVVAANPAPAEQRPSVAHWHRPRRRAVLAFTPVAAAAAALAVALSLSGGQPAIAQAALIKKAAAALDQPGSILYMQVNQYSAASVRCVPSASAPFTHCVSSGNGSSISADPANDTLSWSYQEWASGATQHIVYNDGDQTASSAGGDSFYDASSNSLLTLTDLPQGGGSPGATPLPIPTAQNLEDPSYYEDLYQQAQDGQANLQLVGQATIGGAQTYELSYQIPAQAGGTCGSGPCAPPSRALLIYLDAQTFTPVRTVSMVGGDVWSVTDYTVESLPDTPVNEALLAISPPAAATQVTESYAQWQAALASNAQGAS